MNGIPKKTKIVCTIGPSSWDQEVMREMIASGMNIARVNGAFADRAELDKVTSLVRNVSDKVGLMVDVKGPEIRMNKFGDAKAIKPGDQIIIGSSEQDEIYPANYIDVYKHIQPGQRILIGDGDVELKVIKIEDGKMFCEVQYGELFKPGKALNMPGANYASATLTEKDIENLKYAVELGWDSVSASFIQNAAAAREVRKYLGGSKMQLIAKIEDQDGVDNIDEILQEVDGIMIARGGLGVELGLEKVPMVQKYLIEKANAAGKIVITATQMLESMITNPRPTRAEVNDVAMAIYAGTDAVMLSGESSAGKYPIEAVKEMAKIAMEIEPQIKPHILNTRAIGAVEADAISKAAAQLCMDMGDEIDSVIVLSRRGRTARLMGRHNVKQPIHVFATKGEYVRQLALAKITDAFVMPKSYTDRDEVINDVIAEAKSKGIVKDGQTILFLSRTPLEDDEKFPSLFEIVKI